MSELPEKNAWTPWHTPPWKRKRDQACFLDESAWHVSTAKNGQEATLHPGLEREWLRKILPIGEDLGVILSHILLMMK